MPLLKYSLVYTLPEGCCSLSKEAKVHGQNAARAFLLLCFYCSDLKFPSEHDALSTKWALSRTMSDWELSQLQRELKS